jgi:hypothetical protein
MSDLGLNLTTIAPFTITSSDTSNKDILLVVASVAMVVATLLLIIVVCIIHPVLTNLCR